MLRKLNDKDIKEEMLKTRIGSIAETILERNDLI